MKRTLYLMFCVFTIVFMLTGCAPAAPASAPAAAPAAASGGKAYHIAFVIPDMVNPFWVYMKDGAEKVAAQNGATIETLAPMRPYNVEDQIQILEDLAQKKVDAIVLVAADSNGVIPGVEKANAAGIPVILANTKVFGGKTVTFVGYDNVQAMYTVTKDVLQGLNGTGNVILLEGTPGTQTGADRTKGMEKAVAEFPNIKVLAAENANFDTPTAMTITENEIQRFPQIDAIICANDSIALGAISAITSAGKQGKIKVSGFDGTKDAYVAIVQGQMSETLDQNPWAQSGLGVDAAIKFLNGQTVPSFIPIDYRLVTTKNVVAVAQDRFGVTLMGTTP